MPTTDQLPAIVPSAQFPQQNHPHNNLDRAVSGTLAKLSGGVSPHAFFQAWSDWAQHLVRSPGRQLELVERAQQNVLKIMALSTNPGSPPPSPSMT